MNDLMRVVEKYECLDPANILVREVFAHYGRAIYVACCLESAIANALVYLDYIAKVKPTITRVEYEVGFDAYMAARRADTMGSLIKRVLKFELIETFRAELSQCLELRNNLAHHYFWEHAGEFMIVPGGQLSMIEECDRATSMFESVEQRIENCMQPYRNRYSPTLALFLGDAQAALIETARERLQKSVSAEMSAEG